MNERRSRRGSQVSRPTRASLSQSHRMTKPTTRHWAHFQSAECASNVVCKLGIEDKIPDDSVFCRARHGRFRESDALRRVFEGVVATCRPGWWAAKGFRSMRA